MTIQTQRPRVEGGVDIKGALKAYSKILARNTVKLGGARRLDKSTIDEKRMVAIEAANFYQSELDPHFKEFSEMPMSEIEADRKSTRLNSSHLGISYAVF